VLVLLVVVAQFVAEVPIPARSASCRLIRPSIPAIPRKPEGADHLGETQGLGDVGRDRQDLADRQALEPLGEDPCEPPGGRGLGRGGEEQSCRGVRPGPVDLGDQEDRGLALGDRFEQFRMVRVACGQIGQAVGELQQELQPVLVTQCPEVLDDLGEGVGQVYGPVCGGHRAGTSPGVLPVATGTRTALPHSVQEPS
jgi:hypothetical protein